MGINACILQWFDEIAVSGAFSGLSTVLELGPQDFFFSGEDLQKVAVNHRGEIGEEISRVILGNEISYADRQELFYSLFGLMKYSSVDTYDDRATYKQNLNTDISCPEKFDLIVDCGTSEHVFNIGNVFSYTHNSLNAGGVCLKVLPSFGDNTHGFYNIHPTVYFDVARENDYEIIDFRYIDDMISRSGHRGANSLMSMSDIEKRLHSFAGCASVQADVSRNFLSILDRAREEGRMSVAHSSVDYCFVAMRKKKDLPFCYPGQGVYLTEFSNVSVEN